MSKFSLFSLFLLNFVSLLDSIEGPVRIHGGKPCKISEFPFLVAIRGKNTILQSSCSGALIKDKWVLTVAHCMYILDEKTHQIHSHVPFYTVIGERGFAVIEKHYCHPDFLYHKRQNDICLLKLNATIPTTKYMELPTKPKQLIHAEGGQRKCLAIGWGDRTQTGLYQPKTTTLEPGTPITIALILSGLMCANLSLISVPYCQNLYSKVSPAKIYNSNICTLGEDGTNACLGDSGGPLICDDIQYGIVSWGNGCGLPDSPTVFEGVSYHMSWIEKTMMQAENGSLKSKDWNATPNIFSWFLAVISWFVVTKFL